MPTSHHTRPFNARYWLPLFLAALLCLLGSTLALAQADPPGRVARLNHLEGNASFALQDSGAWSPAEFNRPLTSGDQIAADPGSRAELHSGSTALRLDGRTRLVFTTLDDDTTRIQLVEGTLSLRIRDLYPNERVEINTANLAFVANQPGEYRLDVDPGRGTTRVTLHSGSGVVYGENTNANTLAAPYQASFIGRQLGLVQSMAAAPRDAFDYWAAARDQREDQSIAARYLSRDTIGYQQLDAHGSWSTDPVYGPIWLPRVTIADWAPYRYGHWEWIAPWGWTWIDDAPWGFAPFHYGRWVQINLRWCWVPGPRAPRATYAPALVGFIGITGGSGGAQWSISLGSGGPGVAWFPLAPGEAWQPSYRASPRYLSQINRWPQHRDNHRPTTDYRYRQHAAALSTMPAADFGQRHPGRAMPPQRISADELSRTQVLPPPPRTGLRGDPGRDGTGRGGPGATPAMPAIQPSQRPHDEQRPARDVREPERERGRREPQPNRSPAAPPEMIRPADEAPRAMPPRQQPAQPQMQRIDPPVQRMDPPMRRVDPPVQRMEPPVQRMEPPVQRMEPPVQRIEPRPPQAEPQAAPPRPQQRQPQFEPRPEPAQRHQPSLQEPQRQRAERPDRPERNERNERERRGQEPEHRRER